MSLPSRAYWLEICVSHFCLEIMSGVVWNRDSRECDWGCDSSVQAKWQVSDIYLGEDGGPDGLDLRNLGGTNEGLELVGL